MKLTTAPAAYKQFLLWLCVLVNLSGLFVTIIGPDGALYASIAKTMAHRNSYIELFAEGHDWLDKPHFTFWVTALSFELFGCTTWAYKLPAILFLFMGAYYTYALARDLYNKEVGYWSAIVLLTAEHIIISNNDVRAEPYLTGLIIASVYHFYKAYTNKQYGHLVVGSLFAACAVMTKGMFALIPIGGAMGGEWLMKRDWKGLFHIRWLLAIVLTLVFMTPELYCLYYQFDLHPEKVVFGRTGVSGIRFFFWDSQFGRFFNTGPIKGKGDPSFFLHTTLWAFLPWSLLLYAAVYNRIRAGIRNRTGQEWYTISGALLCFVVFSASSFQLPHYINIIFPFFAIMVTAFVWSLSGRWVKTAGVVQDIIIGMLVLLLVGVHYLFQPGSTSWLAVLLAAGGALWIFFRKWAWEHRVRLLAGSALAMVVLNVYLNTVFYPALLKYQSGSEAAFVANNRFVGVPVVQVREAPYSYALEFYLDQPLLTVDSLPAIRQRPVLVYAPVKLIGSEYSIRSADASEAAGLPVPDYRLPTASFRHFHISRLTFKLLDHRTREGETERYHLYYLP
jgi:4-amino-4-deoxy-L-arabinose transferase-like glycosyltransferase